MLKVVTNSAAAGAGGLKGNGGEGGYHGPGGAAGKYKSAGPGEVPEAIVLMERLALTESVRGLREP